MTDFVEQTWEALGTRVRPLRRMVFVRTDTAQVQSPGGIWFAPQAQDMYSGPMHLRIVEATVLSAGPESILNPGDRVAFQRQYFCRWKSLVDGTYIGWLEENQIAGTVDPDVYLSKFIGVPGDSRQPVVL